MSLVGVRPLLQYELQLRSLHDRGLYAQHRPGSTGLWQVEGRATIGDDHCIELDRRYFEEWSVRSNVKILLRTPWAVLLGAGATDRFCLAEVLSAPLQEGTLFRLGVVGTGYVALPI